MQVNAKLNNLRIAPRKSKLVADLIKGMDVAEALIQLDIQIKRTNLPMKKLLLSAIANGENNFGLDRNNLYVLNVKIGAGSTLKRWMPKAFGRAGQILKRTSRIEIILAERVEGKGRKTKEEMEKEKKKKIEEKKQMEKERQAEEKKEDKKNEKSEKSSQGGSSSGGKEEIKKEEVFDKKGGPKQGWAKKMFNRKSM